MVKVRTLAASAALGLAVGIFSPTLAEEPQSVEPTETVLHVQNPFMDIIGKDGYIGVILKSEKDNKFISRCTDGKVIEEKYSSPEKAYNAILSKCI